MMHDRRRNEVEKTTVAAVVVTYNRKELLRECLQALLKQTRPPDEIIVIDNASTDGTDQMISKEFPQITYVRLPENTGGAGGFYEGIKLGCKNGHDWIWVMDDDAVPLHDALEQALLPDLIKDPRVWAIANAVIYPDQKLCLFHRRRFDPVRVKECPVPEEYYRQVHFEVDTSSFVGMLIRRAAIDHIGLPLKELFIYYDDTEYSLRIRFNGGKIIVVSNSKVVHKSVAHSGNRWAPLTWKHYYAHRNMLFVYRKYGQARWRLYVRDLLSTLRMQAGVILFRHQKFSSTYILWRSLLDGVKGRLGRIYLP